MYDTKKATFFSSYVLVTACLIAILQDTNWMLFTGGMARASYGDKHTVTLMKGEEKHTVFDLTSKVQDFAVIFHQTSNNNSPQSLVILCEEELVAVDLTDDK